MDEVLYSIAEYTFGTPRVMLQEERSHGSHWVWISGNNEARVDWGRYLQPSHQELQEGHTSNILN